jgi:hypothetical protein
LRRNGTEWIYFGLRNDLLSSLPYLQNFDIDINFDSLKGLNADNKAIKSFVLGCPFIPQIRCLSSMVLAIEGWNLEMVNAFCAMLSCLTDLEDLSLLHQGKHISVNEIPPRWYDVCTRDLVLMKNT